jgi:hypothetical protein
MAIKPIKRYGKFTPTGVDDSEARKLEALAGVGKEVMKLAVGYGKAKREQEAVVEGTQKGVEAAKTGSDLETKSPLKFGGSMHDAAMYKAYELESYSVIDSHIESAKTAHPNDTIQYQNVLNGKMEGMLSSAPPEVKLNLQNYFTKANKTAFNSVQTLEKKKTDDQLLAALNVGTKSLENLTGNLARAGDEVNSREAQLEHQMDLLAAVEARILSAEKAEIKIAALKDEVAIQTQEGQVDRAIFDSEDDLKTRAQKGLELVGALRKAPLGELSPTQNDKLLKRLETKVNAVVKEYNDSVKVSDAEARKINGISNVRARVTGELPATSDVITDNDIDNDYNVERLNFKTAPELLMDERIDYVTSVNAVPKTMKTEILSELRSNDPDRVLVAAQSIMELNALEGMPEAFSGQDLIYADTLYRNMEFYEFEEALERAKAIAFPSSSTQKAMVETRKSELSLDKPKRNEMYAGTLDDAFESGRFGFGTQFTPNNIERDAMIADLRTLTEDNYLLGFETFDAALQHSVRKMQNSYKISEFGFLQHAPEEYYGIGPTKDTSWIRQSLHEELVAKYGDGFEQDDIILISDTETSTMSKKGMPTYQALIRMSDGSLQPVDERVNPSLNYSSVLQDYKDKIKEESQVPVLNKKQFLSEHRMTPEQNAETREILRNSTNPFALVGKAIGSIDDAPEFIAKYFKKSLNEVIEPVEFVSSQVSEIPQAVLDWNDQYIASLRKASGKEDIEITVADLSN